MIARNRPRSRRDRVDSGDGGVFALIGLALLALLTLVGVAATVGHWYGADAAKVTYVVGVVLILLAVLVQSLRGGRS